MEPSRTRRTPLALIIACALIAGPLALTPPAAAQGVLGPCTLLPCVFELSTVSWNGTGEPGSFLNGPIRITNTGESEDAYTITVSVDNENWTAEVDPTETDMLEAGDGLLSGDDNTADIEVIVAIPEDALAEATVNVRVTVASQNEDDLADDVVLVAEALQVYAWGLSCTDALAIEKSRAGTVQLTATNLGNGADTASVSTAPLAGLDVGEIERFALAAGATAMQDVELGVGIGLEDGDYPLRWDLAGAGETVATAGCTTTLTVTGGENGGDDDDDETEDGPAPAVVLLVLAVLGLVAWRRRGAGSA